MLNTPGSTQHAPLASHSTTLTSSPLTLTNLGDVTLSVRATVGRLGLDGVVLDLELDLEASVLRLPLLDQDGRAVVRQKRSGLVCATVAEVGTASHDGGSAGGDQTAIVLWGA